MSEVGSDRIMFSTDWPFENVDHAAQWFDELRELPVPRSLADIGMPWDGLSTALELVLKDSYWNPRPLEREPLQRLLLAAFEGAPPVPY